MFWGLVLIASLLVLPPLLMMVWTSITPGFALGQTGGQTLEAYTQLIEEGDLQRVSYDTAVFTLGSVTLAVVLGVLMAWGVARTDMAGKGFVYGSVFVTFSVPGVVEAIGWIFLLGKNAGLMNIALREWVSPSINFSVQSMTGVILVQSLSWAPIVFLLLVAPFRNLDAGLEESARMSGASRWQILHRITIPLLLPSIGSVAILIIIRALQAFEAPYFLGLPAGIRTFTTEIFARLRTSFLPDYAISAAFGSVLLVLLFLLLVIYHRRIRSVSKYATVTGKGYRPPLLHLGKWRRVPGFLAAGLFCLNVAPILSILAFALSPTVGQPGSSWTDVSLENFRRMFGYPGLLSGVTNSLLVASIAATVTCVICAAAAWMVVRSRIRGRQVLDQLLTAPIVIPGTVLGLGLLVVALRVPFALYGTLVLFVVAYVVNYSPYGMRFLQPSLIHIGAELEESGIVHGGTRPRVFARITFPLVASAVAATWLFVFFHALRDLAVASMIYTAGTTVISTQLLEMWEGGFVNVASAFGATICLVSVAVGALVYRAVRRVGGL